MAGRPPEGPAPVSRRRPGVGRVSSFDADRGLGTVEDDRGLSLPFHCTAIADGTRRIDVGAAVTFVVVAGALGRLEARGLVAVPAP
jgi:cold shock CspA family protein